MELYINAFAHYLPDDRVPNSYFKDVNGLDDEWIRTRTGINLKLSEQPETSIGKYGRMRKSYLKEHRPILYNQLLMSEKLYPHLIEIDRTAQERVDTMLPHMMETAGVTEELKACDPMRWVGLMNTLTAQIEEILIRELICS